MNKLAIFILALLLAISLFAVSEAENKCADAFFEKYVYEDFPFFEIGRLYEITVYEKDNMKYADFEICGYQMYYKMKCDVRESEGETLIIFAEDAEGFFGEIFEGGDVLISFRHSESGIITTWHKLRPVTQEVGEYTFTAVSSPVLTNGRTQADLHVLT